MFAFLLIFAWEAIKKNPVSDVIVLENLEMKREYRLNQLERDNLFGGFEMLKLMDVNLIKEILSV